MRVLEGKLTAPVAKIGIVVSRFNEFINKKLLEGALDCLLRHGFDEADITLAWVPGAFEIPLASQMLAAKNDAVICLGCVIRGATPHFDYVASEVAKGVAAVSLHTSKPVIFGVLTTDSIEQAIERAGTKAGNKGWEAALNALEMLNLCKEMK